MKLEYRWLFMFLILVLFASIIFSIQPVFSQTVIDKEKSEEINSYLSKIVSDKELPGMIAAISSKDGVIAIGSAGVRKVGSDVAFTTKDLVHLASCTKAMTSLMIATLVAEGNLSWDTKLIDAIPELKNSIHSDHQKITLWQLLTHRAGLQKNVNWSAYKQLEIKERRLAILKDNLNKPAIYPQGEYHYSNFGYMVASCIAEQITNMSWESLMKKRLFDPLNMTTAGFGATCSGNSTGQPWGHEKYGNEWHPSESYNSETLGPAGRVHCSVHDWAKFLSLFLSDQNAILERKYINKLITPDIHYAGGWGVVDNSWANGLTLLHSGFIGIWYCSVIVAPEIDRAFIVATNSGDYFNSSNICDQVHTKLVKIEFGVDD